MSEDNKIAIIAGNGELPIQVAISAKEQGYSACGIAITKEASQKLESYCNKIKEFSPGQITKILNFVKGEKINKVVFIGKVPKLDLLRNVHKLDWAAIKLLNKLKNLNDDSIHSGVDSFLKEHNIEILPQTKFLTHLFQEKEILSKRIPTDEERIDISYGFEVAKKIASLDIGQTVVVKNKMILAVEAIEGTDEAIKRGCSLSKSEVVVVKVAKPDQDQRFDIPTIGIKTIESLAKSGGGILAFESNETIISEKEKTIEVANKYNICLLGI